MAGFSGYFAVVVGGGRAVRTYNNFFARARLAFSVSGNIAIIIASLAVVCLSAIFAFCWHIPMTQKISDIEHEIARHESAARITESFLHAHPEGIAAYTDELTERRRLSLTALPQNSDYGEFLISLRKTAVKNNVRLVSIHRDEPTQNDTLKRVSVRIVFSADYFSLLNFLGDLRKSERLVHFSALTVKSNGQTLDGTLAICVFYLSSKDDT